MKNELIFEKLANFDLLSHPDFQPGGAIELVCVEMPEFVRDELFTALNTHLRCIQYSRYKPGGELDTTLSVSASLLLYGLEFIDFDGCECEECEDPVKQTIINGLFLVLGYMFAIGQSTAVKFFGYEAAALLLPAGIEYIEVVGTAIKLLPNEERPFFGIEAAETVFAHFPYTNDFWANRVIGEAFEWFAYYRFPTNVDSPLRRINSFFQQQFIGRSTAIRTLPAGQLPPAGATIINVT